MTHAQIEERSVLGFVCIVLLAALPLCTRISAVEVLSAATQPLALATVRRPHGITIVDARDVEGVYPAASSGQLGSAAFGACSKGPSEGRTVCIWARNGCDARVRTRARTGSGVVGSMGDETIGSLVHAHGEPRGHVL